MSQIITLKLPEGMSPEEEKALQGEIKAIAQVRTTGLQKTRGIDAAAIAIWINLVGPAMDVVKKIIDIVHGRGLTGVEIQLPNDGGVVRIDSASTADLKELPTPVRQAS